MKKLICSILVLLISILSFPFCSFATDYDSFCSDTVVYSTATLPEFNSYLNSDSEVCALIYNSYDNYFYLITSRPRYIFGSPYHGNWNFRITNNNFCFYNNWNDTTNTWAVYRYNSSDSNTWVSFSSGERCPAYSDVVLFPVSSVSKFKFLWVNGDVQFSSGNYSYIVTNLESNTSSSFIYANFFNALTGEYLDNDPNVSSSSNDSSNSVNVNIDMSQTNGLLSNISDKLDDVADDVADIKTSLSSLSVLSTINSNIADIKSNLSSLMSINSNVAALKSNFDSFNTAFSSMVTTYISPLKTKIDNIDTVLSGIRADMSTQSNSIVTALGNVQTAVAAVPTGINSRLDNIHLELHKIYISLSEVIGYQGDSTLYSVVSHIKSDLSDFILTWNNAIGYIFDPFITEDENYSIYDNMVAAFSDKFETLYNVILYGDKNGAEAQQAEVMKLNQFQTDLDNITVNLEDAPAAINNNSVDVSAQISIFTQFYNGITGLNAALSSILYFGLIVIFIKKVVGR